MPRYELDDYVHEHVADDAVNANCVASWRTCGDAEGRVEKLSVDLHNGWCFDSSHWHGSADVPGRFLRALQGSERGRIGIKLRPEDSGCCSSDPAGAEHNQFAGMNLL